MNLTFKGFLKIYCAELSGLSTTNIRRLVDAANSDAPRTAEALFVFAAKSNKLSYLIRVSKNTWMYKDYKRLASIINKKFKDVESFLKSDAAPKRYADVLNAYNANFDTIKANRRILDKLRPKVKDALENSGMTKYKVCKELNINKGNFYAYINGDSSKISKEIAYAVIALDSNNKPNIL